MRKQDAAAVAADRTAAAVRDRASMQLVCLALVLSVMALAFRIFSVW